MLLQSVRDPPVECRFVVYVGFLEVSKTFPGCRAVLPLAAQLPANGIPLLVRSTIRSHNNLVGKSNGQVIAVVVYDGIQ